ncbi:MAG: Putative secreted protein [uncultured Sulfurovum sp.]|uniref:Secreted protein n=1 Tax=uncultured Sulfurovum sp. TaxID=269237 RepID=A0A6S6U8B9_9BACT|nr:MAG: Putative secreted protein [uncultured Sulfurovum sp.]
MKNIKLLNTSIISIAILFTACSNSQSKIKKETKTENVSVYNILGITEASNHSYQYQKSPETAVSPDVTFISYKRNDYPISSKLHITKEIEFKAKSFLGIPYVWGATGPNKFDCSGFTQWVYRDVGINIPRVSRDQARVGEFVSYDNLEHGDMVFFDTKKKRTGIVSHVGIYLGDGNFIHASSAGKSVVIYNFNQKTFYKKRFLWGRRVIEPKLQYALN